MDQFAVQLDTDENCATDLQQEEPNVFQAYHGLLAYPSLYNAGCLKDDDGDYCECGDRTTGRIILTDLGLL